MANTQTNGIKSQLSKISPLTIGVVILFAAAMTYIIFRAFAATGTATLYTSPGGTQSVTNGQSFTVSVRISSGSSEPVTGASVYMSYPAGNLQVIGENYSGSPYSTQLVATDSGGVLRMDRAAFPMISGGDQLFAQVTFKAIANGSAAISFTGSSIVTSGQDDSNILSQRNGVTYNISTPASPPPSSGGSSSGSGSSGSSGSSASTGSSKSQPSSHSGGTSASGSSGGSSTSGDSASGGSGGTSSASGGTDANGQTTSDSGASSTIEITVLDTANKPVEGAVVTINGQSAKTDKDGIARFTNIPTGDQTIAVSYNGKKTSKTVQVKGQATQLPETFKVSVVRNKFNPILLFVPVIVLLAVAGFIFRPWSSKLAKTTATGEQTMPDQVVTSNQPTETPQTPAYRKLETPGTVYSPDSSNSKPPAKDGTNKTQG